MFSESPAFTAKEFAPDLTIISAGFDAARGDPLGCCDVRIWINTIVTIKICWFSYASQLE